MTAEIDINDGINRIGKISFPEDGEQLRARRTASGFRLSVPIAISFDVVPAGQPLPMLSGLRGVITAKDRTGFITEIGRLRSESRYKGIHISAHSKSGSTTDNSEMLWLGSLADLAVYERIRDGREPQFEISVEGEISFLLQPKG